MDPFTSETDTEVIVQLIAKHYQGDLVQAVHRTIGMLKGIFAIAVIHKSHPDQIIAAARECPLSVAYDDSRSESIVSSDPNAFLGSTLNVFFLRHDEIAKVRKGKVEIFDAKLKPIEKKSERLEGDYKAPSKEGFEHFMLKEIYEQPSTVQKAMLGRFENGNIEFESLHFSDEELKKTPQVWIFGCGTSAHAGAIGSQLLEDLAHVPANLEISSEARFRIPIISKDSLVLAISQSGETADTLSAVREVKAHGCKVLGICNVKNSALTRESDGCIYMKAGPEVSVCSTKAFTSQMAVLALFSLHMARLRGMSREKAIAFHEELKKIPGQIQEVIEQAPLIQKIAKKYCRYEDFFFMGRRYMYPDLHGSRPETQRDLLCQRERLSRRRTQAWTDRPSQSSLSGRRFLRESKNPRQNRQQSDGGQSAGGPGTRLRSKDFKSSRRNRRRCRLAAADDR